MTVLFSFPNPVNEKAARVVAGCVLALSVLALATSWHWLLPVLAVGFLLRVLTGPRLSPLGLLATRVVAPRLGPPKYVAGPPKRFAQGMGAVMTGAGAVLAFGFGMNGSADVLLVAMIVAAVSNRSSRFAWAARSSGFSCASGWCRTTCAPSARTSGRAAGWRAGARRLPSAAQAHNRPAGSHQPGRQHGHPSGTSSRGPGRPCS